MILQSSPVVWPWLAVDIGLAVDFGLAIILAICHSWYECIPGACQDWAGVHVSKNVQSAMAKMPPSIAGGGGRGSLLYLLEGMRHNRPNGWECAEARGRH